MGAWLPHFPFLLCLYILFTQESRVMELQMLQCDHQGSLLWGIISYWLISKRGWRDLEWLVTEIYTDFLEWDEHREWGDTGWPGKGPRTWEEQELRNNQWTEAVSSDEKSERKLEAQNNSDELVFIKENILKNNYKNGGEKTLKYNGETSHNLR